MQRRVGIVIHRTSEGAGELARRLVDHLQELGVAVCLDDEGARRLGATDLAASAQDWGRADLIITLGGDGTILKAAQIAAPAGVPILGVHLGRFGFIAEFHPSPDLLPTIEALLRDPIPYEERLMVRAEVWRAGALAQTGEALNEVVVKTTMSRLARLKVRLGQTLFATYPADGIVVATPTGSTGYALSVGGPLIVPTIQALILAPICPHTLSTRPIVIAAEETVEIDIEADHGEMIFAVDGEDPFPLQNEDRLVVRRSDHVARLVAPDRSGFYAKVRKLYGFGERAEK